MDTIVESKVSELRAIYGANATISEVGRFTLAHLDNPTADEVERRNAEFDPEEFFFDNCPLCELAKREGGHIIYDSQEEATDAGS